MRLRKVKTISAVLVAVFSLLTILISQMNLSYLPEAAAARYIKKYDVDYFTVEQGYYNEEGKFRALNFKTRMTNATKRYIANYCRSITDGVIESKQDIPDFGLTFVGDALELDDNSYYATTAMIEDCYDNWISVEIDGEYVRMVRELHPIEFLIGKKLSVYDDAVLAGVIDVEKLSNPWAIPFVFYNSAFIKGERINDIYFNFPFQKEKDVEFTFGDARYDSRFVILCANNCDLGLYKEAIITEDGILLDKDDINLADNEIVISYELYANLFDFEQKEKYISSDLSTPHKVPAEVGQTFNLKFYETETGEIIADYGEVKLAGVSFKKNLTEEDNKGKKYKIVASNALGKSMDWDLGSPTVLIQTKSVKNLEPFATTLRRQHLGYVQNVGSITNGDRNEDVAELLYEFVDAISLISTVFLAVGAALAIVFILLIINLISFSITGRKKDIGILSALGATNKDITSIFLIETAILTSICFVVILALSFVTAWAFNTLWRAMLFESVFIPYVAVDILSVTILIVSIYAFPLLAALIPTRKIIKLKPIDAIRNN